MWISLLALVTLPCAAAFTPGDVPPWSSLQSKLPATSASQPKLTFYRDNNGWCPFCERVWIALDKKGIAYDEVLINLQDKPQWFKEMVPTALVPAVKFADTEEVVWESLDILQALDDRHGDLSSSNAARLLPMPGDTAAEALHAANLALVDRALGAGFKSQYAFRNTSLTATDLQGLEADFKAAVQALDDTLAQRGPFLGGASLAAADLALVPMMERYRWQLPATIPAFPFLDARPSLSGSVEWPHVARWFELLEADRAYCGRAQGDAISWLTVTSTFLRLFGSGANGTAPSAEVQAKMDSADLLAAQALQSAQRAATKGTTSKRAALRRAGRRIMAALPWVPSAHASPDALAAATKVLANRDAVVADAAATVEGFKPKSQTTLARLPVGAAPSVEMALFHTCARLLEARAATTSAYADPRAAAAACEYLAARVCAPRDMSAGAAIEFRAALFQEAEVAKRQMVASSKEAEAAYDSIY